MSVQIREAAAADAPGIRRLFARVFPAEMSAEEWDWKFALNPDGWLGTVAIRDGEVVGNYGGWGMRFRLAGQESLIYSVGDVATDPSVRALGGRRGVYRSMAEAFYEIVAARGIPFCFGFPNARALEISNRVVHTQTLLAIRERHVPCGAFPGAPHDAGAGEFVVESFDRLWQDASRFLTDAAVRDRARANWRFHARPNRYYRMVWRESGGQLHGWAALSVVGEQALVADFLSGQGDGADLPALFAAAAAEAGRLGARRLVFWETGGGPGAPGIARLGGEVRDAGFPFVVRSFDAAAADRFARLGHLVPALYDVI
jgi:hypothetical protein